MILALYTLVLSHYSHDNLMSIWGSYDWDLSRFLSLIASTPWHLSLFLSGLQDYEHLEQSHLFCIYSNYWSLHWSIIDHNLGILPPYLYCIFKTEASRRGIGLTIYLQLSTALSISAVRRTALSYNYSYL